MRYAPVILDPDRACAWHHVVRLSQGAYPTRPLRLIVGFAAGGPTDIPARLIADKLGDLLGQRVVVENKPAAGGMLATREALAQPRDGYTLPSARILNRSMSRSTRTRNTSSTTSRRFRSLPGTITGSGSQTPCRRAISRASSATPRRILARSATAHSALGRRRRSSPASSSGWPASA